MKEKASPATVVVALVVVALIVGGLWYKFLGPGSQPPASSETTPTTEQTGEPTLNPNVPPKGTTGEGLRGGTAGEPVGR